MWEWDENTNVIYIIQLNASMCSGKIILYYSLQTIKIRPLIPILCLWQLITTTIMLIIIIIVTIINYVNASRQRRENTVKKSRPFSFNEKNGQTQEYI